MTGPMPSCSEAVRRALAALMVAVLTPVSAAFAVDCRPDMPQQGLNMCAFEDFERTDAALNALYHRLTSEPALSDRLDKLNTSEQAWIAYRDAECRFQDSWAEGGSMQPMLNSDCAKLLTQRRIADLNAALSCVHDSGPMNCRNP